MTLSTLKTMNVPLAALRDTLKVREPAAAPAPVAAAPAPSPARKGGRKPSPAENATPAVDPMQWWGALTKQFTQLATSAMKDSAGEAAKTLAGTMVKQSFDAAEQTLKKAVEAPGRMAGAVAKVASGAANSAVAGSRGRKRAPTRPAKSARRTTAER